MECVVDDDIEKLRAQRSEAPDINSGCGDKGRRGASNTVMKYKLTKSTGATLAVQMMLYRSWRHTHTI